MKKALAAILFLAMMAGCNGGGGSSGGGETPPPPADNPSTPPADSPEDPPAEDDANAAPVTPIGSATGAAVSAVIGAQGGQLATADGGVTLVVPPGAFATDTTVSIQPISNEATGGVGTAYRVLPEGIRSAVPMTLRFRADANVLKGTALRLLTVAYQDADARWRMFTAPQHDADAGTVAVQTEHFSDWSMVAGVQLRPVAASMRPATSKELEIRICRSVDGEAEDELLPVLYRCDAAPDVTYGAGNWSVNGVPGGAAGIGLVIPDADSATNKATYTAPQTVPANNPVAVSVEVLDPDNPADHTQLVSSITILDEMTCDSLKKIESIDAGVAFEPYQWSGQSENQSYDGRHSGRLSGTMKNIIPAGARDLSPLGVWTSQNSPHTGLVTMNDTHMLFYPYPGTTVVRTAVGNGLPHSEMDAPSFITLTVYYDSCEYELVAAFVVHGVVTESGVSAEAPIAPGGIYYREKIPQSFLSEGNLERTANLPARHDPNEKRNGYFPAGQNDELRAQGSTTAYWEMTLNR